MRNELLLAGCLVVAAGCEQVVATASEAPEQEQVGDPTDTAGGPQGGGQPVASESDTSAQGARSLLDGVGDLSFGATVDTVQNPGTTAVSTAVNVTAKTVPGAVGLFEVTLQNTGSGWQEQFLLQVPDAPPATPAPLLVVFHKFGVTHWDILVNTSFLAEARARGWYLVAPLGASGVSFGSVESQINTRAVLDFVTQGYAVDRTRVYGVGFSMGAGAALNYAARHLDPDGVMFAACANHTGTVSLAHVHANEPDDDDADDHVPSFGSNLEVPDILEYWHGGSPAEQPFEYRRSSCVDIDPLGGAVGVDTDLARNLAHVPVLDWVAGSDPVFYLADQLYAFDAHVQDQNLSNELVVVPGDVHQWSTLDERHVCDWLAQFQLALPAGASTLADENGVYFHFQVEQSVSGSFTPFTWEIDPLQNSLELAQTQNLARLSIDTAAAGLQLDQPIRVRMSTGDGSGDRVLFLGVSGPPLWVVRDGVAAWGYFDAQAQTFLIAESTPDVHEWVIQFP